MDRTDIFRWLIIILIIVAIACAIGVDMYMNPGPPKEKMGGCGIAEGFERFVEPAV